MNLSFDDKIKKFDDLSLDDTSDFFLKRKKKNVSEKNDIEDEVKIDEIDEVDVEIVENEDIKSEDDINDEIENIEDIDDSEEKKTDTELIDEYLKPNPRCILCNTPIWALKLNKAYLDGFSYNQMINKFSTKFEERTGRSLNKSLLHRHFKSHFDARAAAIAEYNKRKDNSERSINPTTAQRDIFKLAANKYLDELEMFDATAKELIAKYQELEVLIEEKKSAGKSFGIDDLILKQATILNSLNKQAISKFKALSRVDLESKQGQFLTQLSFIGNKAVAGLSQIGGGQQLLISPQETEEIYLGIVIKQILARLEDPLKLTFGHLSKDQKSLFYRELKKSIEGIQDGITTDFDRQIKNQTKLLADKNKNNQSQEA
jgi:hypothetical protein